MFDWDRDHGDEVAPRSLPPPPLPVPPAGAGPEAPRGWQGQWLGPVMAPVLGLVAWFAVFAPDEAVRVPVSAAAFGTAQAARVPAPAAPVQLVAQDAATAARFRAGLARFGDDDLVRFALALHRDLGALDGPLVPELLDALALTGAALAARGLPVPPETPAQAAARRELAAARDGTRRDSDPIRP